MIIDENTAKVGYVILCKDIETKKRVINLILKSGTKNNDCRALVNNKIILPGYNSYRFRLDYYLIRKFDE